jgi:DNA-binding transcriptional LysR family regulator
VRGHLERRQMAALVAVGEELHFGRAAARLGLQQSALSQLIARLEDQLGFLLFDRSSHHVRITPAGERMLTAARDVLRAVETAEELAARIGAGGSGTLRLAATEGIREELGLMLQRFHDHHAGVEVRVVAVHTAAKLHGLLDGGLDAALFRGAPRVEGVDALELWRERLAAVVSRRHPLAGGTDVSIADLARYPVILASRERNPWAREHAERLFAEARATPVLGPTYSTLQETLAMIAGSEAWTILHSSVAEHESSASVLARRLSDPDAEGPVTLAWRSLDTGPVARAFVATVSALKREGAFELPDDVHRR